MLFYCCKAHFHIFFAVPVHVFTVRILFFCVILASCSFTADNDMLFLLGAKTVMLFCMFHVNIFENSFRFCDFTVFDIIHLFQCNRSFYVPLKF